MATDAHQTEAHPTEARLSEAEASRIVAAFDALEGDLDRIDPDAHAARIAGISRPMAEAFDDAGLRRLAALYDRRNSDAKRAQTWHFRSGRWAAVTAAGAVLATLPLVLLDDTADWMLVRRVAVALQGLFVLLTGLLSLYVYLGRPRARWLAARSEAEAARRGYFRRAATLPLPLPAAEALTLGLEFFRRFQLETQRDYYALKQPAARRDADRARRAYLAGLIVSGVAALPTLVESASLLVDLRADAAPAGADAGTVALFGALSLIGKGSSVFAACGVIATALLAFVAALAALDTSRRNAESYAENLQRLETIAERDLPAARASAQRGDAGAVLSFVSLVDAALASEQGEWAVIGRSRETA